MMLNPSNMIKTRRDNMYFIYYELLKYFLWMFLLKFLMSLIKTFSIWLLQQQELERVNLYGFESDFFKFSALFYLPENDLKNDFYFILVNLFFFLTNFLVYGGFTLTMVNLEYDLEDVYGKRANSEISLFTLFFEDIPQKKYLEFETLIRGYLKNIDKSHRLLCVSHIYNLTEYFNFTKNLKKHKEYKNKKKMELSVDPEDEEEDEKIEEEWNRKTLEELKVYVRNQNDTIRLIEEEKNEMDKFMSNLGDLDSNRVHPIRKKMSFEEMDLDEQELNFFRIKDKITRFQRNLYMNKTFISFTSIKTCVTFLRIFHSDLQKEILADIEDPKYDYLLDIKAKMAPFIDDIRWENFYKIRRFYILQNIMILFVSAFNFFLEYHYHTINLSAAVLDDGGYNVLVIFRLLYILSIQIILSVVTIVLLEKSIDKFRYPRRSQKTEVKFFFFNFFLIVNNIIVVFYGFAFAANSIAKVVRKDNMGFFRFYINLQWVKNCSVIVFLPLIQRILGDYFVKVYVLPCSIKILTSIKKKIFKGKKNIKGKRKEEEEMKNLNMSDSNNNNSGNMGLRKKKSRLSKILEEDHIHKLNLTEPTTLPKTRESRKTAKKIRNKPTHDFGLHSSYLVQIFFFSGFYLTLSTPVLQFILFMGILVNFMIEKRMLKKYYKLSLYVSISNIFFTLKFAFLFFCIGVVLSVQNSRAYAYIVRDAKIVSSLEEMTGFGHMVSFCIFTIALLYLYQMNTSKIMFRVLRGICEKEKEDDETGRRDDYFYKTEYVYNNYKEQNPFYTLRDVEPDLF